MTRPGVSENVNIRTRGEGGVKSDMALLTSMRAARPAMKARR